MIANSEVLDAMSLSQFSQIYWNDPRNSLLHHRNSVNHIGGSHCAFIMGDDNKLGILAKTPYNVIELINIGIIEWSIYLIENTEWCRL